MNSTNYSKTKLEKARNATRRFLYSVGVNVALDEAEASKTFAELVNYLNKSIRWQIAQIATEENIDRLLEVSKVYMRETNNRKLAVVLDTMFEDYTMADAEASFGFELEYYLKWAADAGGQAVMDKMNIKGVFGVTNLDWLDFLAESRNLLIDTVDGTTKKWIAGILEEGVANQLSSLEIRDLLIDEAKGMSKERALLIARTEVANAMNKTELESYRRSGIREKMWRTSRDERVCPICAPLDKKVVGREDNFEQVHKDKQYTSLTPPIHVNCRCFMQAVEDEIWVVNGKRVWAGG